MDKTFICFGAHPDDIEFSCTGFANHLLKQGYTGYFVIVTNGENGFRDHTVDKKVRIATRKKEQQRVAEAMGIEKVFFLDYRDGFLKYTEELRRDLVTILKTYRPEMIISFDPANKEFDHMNLFHRDHRIVAEAVFDAVFAAKNRFMFPGEPHRVKKMYFYGSHKPTFFFDIGDFIDRKMELLSYHESQFADFSKVDIYVREWLSDNTAAFKYSEAFRVMPVFQLT